ncbi:MAG: trehalose-6-phosphate synthase [Dehalococcoidia bacterium]|nr:trehalose-6-phosphate synthase [Dehalococcoidia bacterium]
MQEIPTLSHTMPRPAPERSSRRLVVASHRGPIEYYRDRSRHLRARHGSGGLVTALTGLAPLVDLSWVAAAMTEADREVAARHGARARVSLGTGKCWLRFVTIPEETYDLHYSIVSNPILWFVQHSLCDEFRSPEMQRQLPRAWEEGYLPVNRLFAQAVAKELQGSQSSPFVMVQDYHLYMCSSYLRALSPSAVVQHFVHIPWPAPAVWAEMPREYVASICRSLLEADVVGFQTRTDAHNFLATCHRFLGSALIDFDRSRARVKGRRTRVKSYPISVDVLGLRQRMRSPEVAAYRKRLAGLRARHTIVKVDRLDPIKDIATGLEAFDLLLRQHPELIGEIKMLAFLVPSRETVPQYEKYADDVRRRVAEINARYGNAEWRPIEAFEENNYPQALAGMSLYDVLLVNSVADGMNLVSKEGPVVNQRDGVLVLSRGAGSYAELRSGALGVEPRDVEGTAKALWQALNMPAEEKRERARRLRNAVERHDLRAWLRDQLQDLEEIASQRETVAAAGQAG